MDTDLVVELVMNALKLAVMVALPMLAFALIVGLVVSVFQAVTQIQEMTLSFVPKIIAIVISVAIFFPWMIQIVVNYSSDLLININNIIGK